MIIVLQRLGMHRTYPNITKAANRKSTVNMDLNGGKTESVSTNRTRVSTFTIPIQY